MSDEVEVTFGPGFSEEQHFVVLLTARVIKGSFPHTTDDIRALVESAWRLMNKEQFTVEEVYETTDEDQANADA